MTGLELILGGLVVAFALLSFYLTVRGGEDGRGSAPSPPTIKYSISLSGSIDILSALGRWRRAKGDKPEGDQ